MVDQSKHSHNEHCNHPEHGHSANLVHTDSTVIDPVGGMKVDPATAKGGKSDFKGQMYYFCNPKCKVKFDDTPDTYLKPKGMLVEELRARSQTGNAIRALLIKDTAKEALGVPVAAGLLFPIAGILLSPMLASLAMSLSSVSVIVSSLRLNRTKV